MKHEDVAPHIRHLVEVYVGTDNDPAYRGTLLWQMDDTSVVVHSGPPGEEYRQTTEPVLIADIRKIVPRGDPPWLVASNKSAAIISASAILSRAQDEDTD
jgi:hypothetical protein